MSEIKFLKFIIPGKVKAKQSVKFAKIGNFVKKYTPKDMIDYANWVKICFRQVYPNHLPSELINYRLFLRINVYFAMPKSFSKIKREKALNGSIRPTVKPDWDNISKNICDALNKLAFEDDKAITTGIVNKFYAENDFVEVEIQGIENI